MVKGNRQAPRSYTPERWRRDAARGDRVRTRRGGAISRLRARKTARATSRLCAPTDASRTVERSRAVRATRARRDARARYRRARVDGSRAPSTSTRARATRARARRVGVGATRNPQTRAATSRMRLGGARAIRAHTYLRRTLSDHEGVELRESVAPCTSRTRIRVVRRLTGRTGRQFIPG